MDRREFIEGAAATAALALAAAPAAAIAPFRSERLSVVVRGTGPDVILVPGLTATRAIWNGLVSAVPGYRYHLFQVAGFGGTAVGGNAKGKVLAPLTDEIARYIAARGLKSPAIVGHSMGGTIAMMLGTRYPARVGKIMVVDMLPAPAGMFGASTAGLQPFADALLDTLTNTPGGQRLLNSMLGGGARQPNADANLVARATHELALTDLSRELSKLSKPMTVVYATPRPARGIDPEAPVRTYRSAYRTAPTAKLVRIANSGHNIMFDQPAHFTATVRTFLRE